MTTKIAEPADAYAAHVTVQRLGKLAWIILPAGERQPWIKTGLYTQKHCKIRHIAGHGAGDTKLLKKNFVARAVRNTTNRRSKTKDVVECRWYP